MLKFMSAVNFTIAMLPGNMLAPLNIVVGFVLLGCLAYEEAATLKE